LNPCRTAQTTVSTINAVEIYRNPMTSQRGQRPRGTRRLTVHCSLGRRCVKKSLGFVLHGGLRHDGDRPEVVDEQQQLVHDETRTKNMLVEYTGCRPEDVNRPRNRDALMADRTVKLDLLSPSSWVLFSRLSRYSTAHARSSTDAHRPRRTTPVASPSTPSTVVLTRQRWIDAKIDR
jgi:hypothetical protein